MLKELRVKFSLFLLISLLGSQGLHAEKNPFIKPFPFKEGVVTYAVRGNQSGSRVLYFHDYGREQLIVENLSGSILDNPAKASRITLIKPDGKYIINPKTDHAKKIPLLATKVYEKFQKLTKEEQKIILKHLKKSSDRSLAAFGTSCTSDAKKIIGLSCTKEQLGGVTQCSIARGGLVLEKSVSLLGYRAYTFATGYQPRKVDPKFFQLPKGLEIELQDGDIEQKAQKVIDRLLKHPDLCEAPRTTASKELQRFMFEEIQNLSKQF